MLRHPILTNRTVITLTLALSLMLPVFATPAQAAGDIVYQGVFDAGDLRWSAVADGDAALRTLRDGTFDLEAVREWPRLNHDLETALRSR